jgi:CO dehydrogenase maturation factor
VKGVLVGTLSIGVVGKGGVGKTTVSGLIARAYAARGAEVVAVDTDSNPNLGLSLGMSVAEVDAVPVLPRSLMVGSDASTTAEALVAEYGRPTPAGPVLVSALRVAEAGAGCTCGGHATVRGLLAEALDRVDVTVVDMEAGIEHLSRAGGTLAYADVLLVVCEPTRKAVVTARRTAELAAELGIAHVLGLGNKTRGEDDEGFLRTALPAAGVPVVAVLPWLPDVTEADRAAGTTLLSVPPAVEAVLTEALGAIEERVAAPTGLRAGR